MSPEADPKRYNLRSRQKTLLGLTKDQALKGLFGGNALVSLIVLALITVFLFREGKDFFWQYRDSIQLFRASGLEYVQVMREEQDAFNELNRYLNAVRTQRLQNLTEQGMEFSEAREALKPQDAFFRSFERLGSPLRRFVIDLNEIAMEARNAYVSADHLTEHKQELLAAGLTAEADAVEIVEVDLAAIFSLLKAEEDAFRALNDEMAAKIQALVADLPQFPEPELNRKMLAFKSLAERFVAEMDEYEQRLAEFDREATVGLSVAFFSFIAGKEWVTNSSIQDWYGLWPLFSGSLLVATIAMSIATPLGVGAAIYINQVAGPKEQNFVKPYIEFISAIPSVVIGFFGVVVFGELVRTLSGFEALSWVPFFPLSERLTAFTAGCLLALMAVPTIFTLAEDALNNVPKSYKEASLAMGATRLQTIGRIIVPTSLSGIISAILLGFGRVIGETMVVLLCAGNRIAVPDFTDGLGAFFEPVHTMTGIIAQELGEVDHGSLHYRALFMVGMTLFLISLLVNYFAQKIVIKYQISRG